MLTEEQRSRYHDQGFLVPGFSLTPQELDLIRQQHGRLLHQHPEFEDYCPALLAFDTGFLNFARNPDLLDQVGQLIGEDFALWNCSFFAKPARKGKRVPWHQDGEYWPISPLATCSVWLAIDDSTLDNGCLQVIPGSHRQRKLAAHRMNNSPDVSLSLELEPQSYNTDDAVPIELKAGELSFHDVFLMHGSGPNTSGQSRRGMTMRFMPTSSVYQREKGGRSGRLNMAERTLYLMRGTDLSGENNFRVRY